MFEPQPFAIAYVVSSVVLSTTRKSFARRQRLEVINSGKTKDVAEANELTRGLTKTSALVETLASVSFLVLALLISVVLWYIFFFFSIPCTVVQSACFLLGTGVQYVCGSVALM